MSSSNELNSEITTIDRKQDELYERLVKLRKMTGMSCKEFAEFIGIPENTYRQYEASNPKYRSHMKKYVIDLLEYKLTMEGKVPGPNGNNVLDWLERIYGMLKESYEFRPVRKISFVDVMNKCKQTESDNKKGGFNIAENTKSN